MGRRSINTTKSGKYMNPTDQARKEARKKELKKNKRQRQMVRAAVLKMKDPTQILEELQKIDEMEYNVLQPSPLNEKVLKEKRKKLRETFDRVLKMYDKDDPEKWVELKRQEMEYEKRRAHLISYYESVKHAQSVQVDDIPLPTLQFRLSMELMLDLIELLKPMLSSDPLSLDPKTKVPDNLLYGNMPSQIPLPLDPIVPQVPVKPILKKDSAYKERPVGLQPPGVPPCPPPDLFDILLEAEKLEAAPKPQKKTLRFHTNDDLRPPGECAVPHRDTAKEDFDGEAAEESDRAPSPRATHPAAAAAVAAPKPTSLQQRMLALSGQNIDDFMKEMEEVHKKRERDRAADLNARLTALKRKDRRDSDSDSDPEEPSAPPADAPLEPPGTELRQIPPPLMPPGLRPPPLRAPMGPPPLRMPPGPPPGLPPRAMLRPPGPPPGAPPRLLRPLVPPPPPKLPNAPVLSAAPQLVPKKDSTQGATISAKPQIRNLSADVTRFVPSALRVKREDKKMKLGLKPGAVQKHVDTPKQAPTKDDAYMQFMKEMEGLL